MDVCGAGTSNEGEFAQAEVICSLRGKCGWKTCRSRFTPQPPRRKRDHHPSYGPSAACWATATSIGARLHWVQALSSLWWTVVGAGVLPGLSCPCLGWKKGLAERGVGKQCKVTGCCFFFFFPLLLLTCAQAYTLWKEYPSPCLSKPNASAMGETTEPIFHLARVILVRRGTPLRSPERCLGMCE